MEFQQQEKIASMQKFVPYLSKLIANLKKSGEHESKIVQMELLHKLLICTDPSVTIDELNKCEAALNGIFDVIEEDHNLPEKILESNLSASTTALNSNGIIKNEIEDYDISSGFIEPVNNESKAKQSLQESTENNQSNEDTIQTSQTMLESCGNLETDSKKIEEESIEEKVSNLDSYSENISENSDFKKQINSNENASQIKILSEKSKSDENELIAIRKSPTADEEENVELVAVPLDTSELIVPDSVEHEQCDTQDEPSEEANNIESCVATHSRSSANIDAGQQPEDEKSLHVAEAEENSPNVNEPEISIEEAAAIPCANNCPEQAIPIDSLQIEQETEKCNDINETPINNFEIKSVENVPTYPAAISDDNVTGDDDDVQLIENRNSPICIDSDDGGPDGSLYSTGVGSIEKIRAFSQIRKVVNPPRTFARKSTAVAQQVPARIPQMKKAIEAFTCLKNPRHLVETIDLLESSDDDNDEKPKTCNFSVGTITITRSPPKRTLLPIQRQYFSGTQNRSIYANQKHKSPPTKYGSPVKKPKHTAQSNFLNAVNLQPRSASSSSSSSAIPATFSAKLSNKNIIIPNAFYGNPPSSLVTKSSTLMTHKYIPNLEKKKTSNSFMDKNEPAHSLLPSSSSSSSSPPSSSTTQDHLHKVWLENFLAHFSNPLQIASHSCFVLLQRVLKYRFFQRVKESRTYLNNIALKIAERKDSSQMLPANIDIQLLLDLRNVFLVNDTLTDAGRRFCEYASFDLLGKSVILTTDIQTRKVTCRTQVNSNATLTATAADGIADSDVSISENACHATSAGVISSISFNNRGRPKKCRKISHDTQSNCSTPTVVDCNSRDNNHGDDDNDVEYQPYKAYATAASVSCDGPPDPLDDEISQERRKSLRTNRTKRKEKGFSYSEDQDDAEFEALARKLERQKKEEIREREMASRAAARSTAKKSTSGGLISSLTTSSNGSATPLRKKLRVTNVESICNDDEDDLLTPTWVEAADGDVIDEFMDEDEGNSIVYDCDDDEEDAPTSTHSIQPRVRSVGSGGVSATTNISKHHTTVTSSNTASTSNRITSAAVKEGEPDDDDPFDDMMYPDPDPNAPKNTDRTLHLHNKYFEFCVHCRKRVPRIVHHYVNEHPGSEVYTSRIRAKDLIRVLTTENLGKTFTYKNGQIQYEALCIFCNKECKFMLPYWFEHFTMHTGEYSYKCSACDTLKPTRSLLTNHTANQCTSKGSIVRKYIFDTKKTQIEATVCNMCNYLQMHRKNVVRHLKTQHEIETILPEHMATVVLMQTVSIDNSNSKSTTTAVIPEYLLPQSIDSGGGGGGGGGGVSDQSVNAPSWAATNPASVSSTSLENFNSTSTFFNDVDADYTYNDCGDDDDDGDDLSYMICGMLDVATNDVNQTLDKNRRRRSDLAPITAGQIIADAASNQDNSV